MSSKKQSNNNLLKSIRQRNFLNKDFDGFRNDLVDYSRTYYPDKVRDFSDSSLGGALVDLAAYVGDVMSYYLDHQFGELDLDTAVETENIQRLILQSGIDIPFASPSVVYVDFFIEVPAIVSDNKIVPNTNTLPIIEKDTTLLSDSSITFTLTEDVDFGKLNKEGNLDSDISIGTTDSAGDPVTYILQKSGLCVSGEYSEEEMIVGTFQPFIEKVLDEEDISEIVDVVDDEGTHYYEVESLTQDTVFKSVVNISSDNIDVPENLTVLPAPYRFTATKNFLDRNMTLTFGGGNADSLEDDIIPDPSQFSIPLYGKKINKNYALDPNSLLTANTFGVVRPNTTVTIKYRHGGGLDHNVDARTINTVDELFINFPKDIDPTTSSGIRVSLDVVNFEPARGGSDPLTINQLKALARNSRSSQNRIVTKEDLLARIYTMPSNFGRVFRASIKSSRNNPFATKLYVATRDIDGKITIAPDALKKNLQTYLNRYRLMSDAIDMLDADVINIGLNFEVLVDKSLNKRIVLQDILSKLVSYFNIENFHIEQPISISDVKNIIYNTEGVISLTMFEFVNFNGVKSERQYSKTVFDVKSSEYKGIIMPPEGAIFEIKFPDEDIVGTAI